MTLIYGFPYSVEVIVEREEIIRSLIKEKGMTIKSFAELIEIPYTTLHSMLDRGIGKASVDSVIKVCRALGITIEELEVMSERISNTTINTIAAHAISELDEDQINKVIAFAKFIKSQEDNE